MQIYENALNRDFVVKKVWFILAKSISVTLILAGKDRLNHISWFHHPLTPFKYINSGLSPWIIIYIYIFYVALIGFNLNLLLIDWSETGAHSYTADLYFRSRRYKSEIDFVLFVVDLELMGLRLMVGDQG